MASDPDNGGADERPDRLRFEGDPGAGRSKWLAIALALALAAWLGSGYVLPSEEPAPAETRSDGPEPVQVAVRRSEAEPVMQFFVAEGQTEPERDTQVRAEATGNVTEMAAAKGDTVEAGQLIASIAQDRARADLERAEEEVDRARRDFENAQTLLESGAGTVDRVAQTRAALAAAESQLTSARETLEDTRIRAPFGGRVESLDIEEGEFVSAGSAVARIVDLAPLTVSVSVPQGEIAALSEGQTAEVSVVTGETREGRVAFLGSAADPQTRTFSAEVEVANDDGAIPAGVSARVRIPKGEVAAHFLSPAILSLDPTGRLGIKTVTDEETVAFHPVEIVRAGTEGIWVTGLPDQARVITVGQGFVSEGEAVAARPEEDLELGQMRDRLLDTPDAPEGERP
ncbi:MAG: efflux RND transporter periplasmic adaptor subunit [Armatimonadota bacterium]